MAILGSLKKKIGDFLLRREMQEIYNKDTVSIPDIETSTTNMDRDERKEEFLIDKVGNAKKEISEILDNFSDGGPPDFIQGFISRILEREIGAKVDDVIDAEELSDLLSGDKHDKKRIKSIKRRILEGIDNFMNNRAKELVS